MGLIAALHQPCVIEVDRDVIRLRGIEEVEIDGNTAAVLQEWVVLLA